MGEDREGRAAALLPILIFLLIFLGSGFITGDFYSMPAIVAFLIALLAALVQNRELGFSEKIKAARRAGAAAVVIDRPGSGEGISLDEIKGQLKEWMDHEKKGSIYG